ncbi:MAG: GGDEF domain-containing protein [Pseudomonadales bacterium]|jgi:diguanylate cyclase (GGDEF)-like protein
MTDIRRTALSEPTPPPAAGSLTLALPDAEREVRSAVLRKVMLVTVGAMVASVTSTVVLRVFFGPVLDGVVPSLTVAALVPGLIAPIGSWRLLALTERLRIANEHLRILSETDPLTSALNRRRFLEVATQHLDLAARHAYPTSFLLIDFDHFKRINDRFGHLVGDQVLVDSTALIRRICRRTDALARFGGEEFILLLPHTAREGALIVAERLREELRSLRFRAPQGARAEYLDLTVTISVGGATSEASDTPIDTLISHADALLYAAKDGGRDRCVIEVMPESATRETAKHPARTPRHA